MEKPSPVKVVFIETQYVKTDELHFKSVVQKLTGKCPVINGDLPKRVDYVDEGIVIQDADQGYVGDGAGFELFDPLMVSALRSPMTNPEEVLQSYFVEPTAEEFYKLWSY
ncbi:VQ domain-containing protein [Dioscorea alata]|uniref:VQ domain-containing protein n=1 Tax=Dioscorea alata TaxID=55571 RepID=A0ACB7WD11_DIOAL|nr:VQ domain-containing protein [Dioscorea alata]